MAVTKAVSSVYITKSIYDSNIARCLGFSNEFYSRVYFTSLPIKHDTFPYMYRSFEYVSTFVIKRKVYELNKMRSNLRVRFTGR